jgi:hypothetical protein
MYRTIDALDHRAIRNNNVYNQLLYETIHMYCPMYIYVRIYIISWSSAVRI